MDETSGHGGARTGAGRKRATDEAALAEMLDAAWPKEAREKAVKSLARLAQTGNVKAASLLLAYAYGKPLARQENTGEDGGPLRIEIVDSRDEVSGE